MTDYKALYAQKLMTADAVAEQVQSNWLFGMDTGPSQTPAIMAAVANKIRNSDITGVKVQTLLDVYPFEFYADDSLKGKMTGYSWFSSGGARKAVNAGYADILPAYYRDVPRHIRVEYEYDAFCVSVSPMDSHGYFSLANNGSYAEAMMDKAKRIFVEVNDQQPRCLCGTQIHVSQVDAIVEFNHELPVLPPVVIDETSRTIGNLIAEQIPDGACIQLGIGAIPDATGMALKAKHDLGIHTEMFTDSMVELIECGAVNNSKKQIHRGKSVTTFAYGSKRIYDYIDDNPAIEILPVDYVNDPAVICKNDNMISINAALEVDFFGQVCAESVGTKHMSGSGGQIDYVRGACQSKGGKSFIAFTSTAKGGTISKIKPILTPGAICTTSKNDVDYIVTEYGIAHLRGRSLGERTKQLIAIAHPDFRDELTFEAKKRGILI
ncbi:MAG: acetyl-CoA hydrolase/transferase C-terminal domain-containing protein [Oscillospiraceae bacterium]|nr:acetyl-CoA hydrolase/transferase C-terminal domain-containing protein [Oscillospiraceae bacterium]